MDTKEKGREYRDYLEVMDAHRADIDAATNEEAKKIPAFKAIIEAMTPEQTQENQARSQALQRAALLEGDWEPYLSDLRSQGTMYARQGIPFGAWFELTTAYRQIVLDKILDQFRGEPERLASSVIGMTRFIDIALAGIGQAYLHAKEDIIVQQQTAIRELSTPVLQVRPRLLVVPLIGVVDTLRARQLTEAVLREVRDRRARVVILDITGVPIVDSKVANHLVQTVEAAGLMGARVIISGISAGIARTLVTIGADLKGVATLADLQDALSQAEAWLGFSVSENPAGAFGAEG